MTKITPKVKTLARRLRSEYRQIRSWRKLTARYNNPLIKPRTLHRIATSLKLEGVQWYPKDPAVLLTLGLIKQRKPRTIKRLEDHTRDELINMRDRYARKLEHIDTLIGDPS